MSTPAKTPPPARPAGFIKRFVVPALSRSSTHVLVGAAILLLDLFTGPFLQFPILFVLPVTLSAWFCSRRLALAIAILLPVGRLLIADFVESESPFSYLAANCFTRVTVLTLIAFLASRTARLTKELEGRVADLVTICAWSRTVEYQGEWISFEQYLLRRFNVNSSHSISPEEAAKVFGPARKQGRDAP